MSLAILCIRCMYDRLDKCLRVSEMSIWCYCLHPSPEFYDVVYICSRGDIISQILQVMNICKISTWLPDKRQILCHKKCYIQLSQSRPCTGEVQTRHEYWNLYVAMLWLYRIVESSGCKHGRKRCSLLWQKRQNSSKISMDRLIKVDEKTSVSNIIHVSYIRSLIETRLHVV